MQLLMKFSSVSCGHTQHSAVLFQLDNTGCTWTCKFILFMLDPDAHAVGKRNRLCHTHGSDRCTTV